ncbi:MAG: choice-of-anchor D domain-containing protein [Candidatus Acidiferrales bacterium]
MNGVFTSDGAHWMFILLGIRGARVARLVVTVLAFLGLFGTFACVASSANANEEVAKGKLVITPNAVSFGSVGVGSSASQTVIVSNRGGKYVTVMNVSATGTGFSVSGFSGPKILKTGETIKLTVDFKPKSAGERSGSISVTISQEQGETTATLTGMGSTSKLSMTPSAVDFGKVSVGNPVSQTLKLTNEGSDSVSIKSASVSGTGFSMSGLTTPQTLTPKESVTFTAKFDPKSAGTDKGTISVTASGGTDTIDLSGLAVSSKVALSASATSITFGNVKVGSTVTQTVTLKSTGNSSVDISDVSVSGSGYTFSGVTSHTVLDPGQSAVLSVSFDPKTTGSLPGTVTISSNAPNPQMKIGLSGDGTSGEQPSVDLNWDKSTSSGVVGYYVYRSLNSGKTYSILNSQADSGTSYTDNSVASGQSYVYVVTSVNSSGVQSAYSNPIDVTIPSN